MDGGSGSAVGLQEVVVVDDHHLLAHSLVSVLRSRGFAAGHLVPEHMSGADVEESLLQRTPTPAVVLLDLDLGEAGRALPLVRPLVKRGARVLIVSASTDATEIGACLEAGACGFVAKAQHFEDLLQSVVRVLRHQPVISEQERLNYLMALWEHRGHARELAEPFRRLTRREEEVLHLLCEGHSAQSIAQRWFVSLATVRTHVRAILTKLEVTSQLEAVAQAHRSGWHIVGVAERAG